MLLFPLFCFLCLQPCVSEQCGGKDPIKDLLFGCANHHDVATHICCHNHNGAEHRGFLSFNDIALFDKLEIHLKPKDPIVFYDSVCGKPLFVAPRGRSYEDFRAESLAHGWPSFRPEETVNANVNVLSGGRMESVCGTHLGHNLPDLSGARYCIDLVCIAGRRLDSNASLAFDPNDFVSKEANPGQGLPTYIIVAIVLVGLLAIVCCVILLRRHMKQQHQRHVGVPTSENRQTSKMELHIEEFKDEAPSANEGASWEGENEGRRDENEGSTNGDHQAPTPHSRQVRLNVNSHTVSRLTDRTMVGSESGPSVDC